MQTKTIAKTIKRKLIEWLKTIDDEELRQDVQNNIIVSGGCITSMFMGEPVNDYDVYLKDINVAYRLAKYYTKSFDNITVLNGLKKAEYLELYSIYENEDTNYYTKSVITNLKPNQVKLLFENKEGGMKVNEKVKTEDLNYTPLYLSSNAISLSNQLQIVLRFTGNIKNIHRSFDFIHATNYYTFDKGLVTNKAALESILTKTLKYQGSLYPVTSIIRIKKFLKRGFNISALEQLKIMFQISQLDLTDPNVLEEQLIGVDVAYFSMLINMLRKDEDNKPIDYDRISILINLLSQIDIDEIE